MHFPDRRDAGRQLGRLLLRYRDAAPAVLALPRGGVPVGYEVARALGAPLDVLVARKIGAPSQPELGIGAIASGGVIVLDERTLAALGVTEAELEAIVARETAEMERRLARYRGDRPPPELRDRTVVVVDDGLATGVTARAAVASVRLEEPRAVVLAVPVAAHESARAFGALVDDLVAVIMPHDFRAVGLWYEDFEQTSDEEVLDLLDRARRHPTTDSGDGHGTDSVNAA
jgi:putative phosphoribosyl transferase